MNNHEAIGNHAIAEGAALPWPRETQCDPDSPVTDMVGRDEHGRQFWMIYDRTNPDAYVRAPETEVLRP